ncbi:MAG: hypothetical protein AAF587_29475 [Bacteroidota bacterium]
MIGEKPISERITKALEKMNESGRMMHVSISKTIEIEGYVDKLHIKMTFRISQPGFFIEGILKSFLTVTLVLNTTPIISGADIHDEEMISQIVKQAHLMRPKFREQQESRQEKGYKAFQELTK